MDESLIDELELELLEDRLGPGPETAGPGPPRRSRLSDDIELDEEIDESLTEDDELDLDEDDELDRDDDDELDLDEELDDELGMGPPGWGTSGPAAAVGPGFVGVTIGVGRQTSSTRPTGRQPDGFRMPQPESEADTGVLWVTVSDRDFFPGTLACVNSIRHYHPGARIEVVTSDVFNAGLTEPQLRLLDRARVTVYPAAHFGRPGRVLGAWQLKAYAAADLSVEADLIVGIDSDAVLCSSVADVIAACRADGKMRGGEDGDGTDYDESYAPYGFPVPARNPRYMSTSLYVVPLTADNRRILADWSAACDTPSSARRR